jgi:ABC-type antimicrobial peptide transport system permease subunit
MHVSDTTIQEQVRLPFRVALGIVMQGLRIRLGRSLVTMSGVALGVAFLMSILSSNHFRQGMAGEIRLRQESARMQRFLENEMGQLRGRRIAVYAPGTPSALETRLQLLLNRAGVSTLPLSPGDTLTDGADALLIFSEPRDFPPEDREKLTLGMAQPLIAWTRDGGLPELPAGFRQVLLGRVPRPGELERAEILARQERVRSVWIITIALLVTVIGITNALLMSVTERFREIGTMKCLGALGGFIRRVFFIESALIGFAGSLLGGLLGFLVAFGMYCVTFGPGLVWASMSLPVLLLFYLITLLAGVVMAILAAIYPAGFASRMVPATALRSNI